MITETKLDDTFPNAQFLVPGFSKPFHFDRNKKRGGIMIYVREDIPSKLLQNMFFLVISNAYF